jgi:hypothetical protein
MTAAGCTSAGRFTGAENMDGALDMLDGIVSELVEKQEERGSKGEIKIRARTWQWLGGGDPCKANLGNRPGNLLANNLTRAL